MQERYNAGKLSAGGYRAMVALETYLHQSGLEEKLVLLVKLRASQINGCAFCIDMHWKEARVLGETEQRLYGLDAWREASYYSDRERAALEWTEAVTLIREGHASDEVYDRVRGQFSEKELSDLTLAVAAINSWNRVAIASRAPAGSYQPAARPVAKTG